MDFQLVGLFDELNAQAGLPNAPRNVPCATGHLPGPMARATGQQKPTFSIGAFSDFRTYEDTFKSRLSPKVRCEWPKIGQPHDPSTCESGGTNGTY